VTGINQHLSSAPDNAIRISGGRRAALDARAALSAELDGRVGHNQLRDLHLLLSEVVNNRVVHGGVDGDGWIEIAFSASAARVRVEVRDSGEQGAPVRREPDYENGGGFGLFLVEAMATRWGAERNSGLTVWFELDLSG
jgi:anti-sigma regulatory factor (Ser/Thr protein kinase)